MSTTTRIGGATLAVTLLLSLPIVGSAYEVTILEGRGAETKALNAGEYDDAIRRLEQKLEQRRHYRGILLTNLCTALVIKRDLEKAHTVCNEAVEIEGSFVGTAYNSRGVLHAMMGDQIAAMADFAEAAKKTNYPVGSLNDGPRGPGSLEKRPSDNLDKALFVAKSNRQFAVGYFDKLSAGVPDLKREQEQEDEE